MSADLHSAPPVSTPDHDAALASLREAVPPSENLAFGVAAGLVAMLVGTAAWVAVTAGTGYQIGYLAVGVGFLVGFSMRKFGRGGTPLFAGIAAGLSLLGCALGNLFTGCHFISSEFNLPFGQVVGSLDLTGVREIMTAMFSPIDVLFYGLAIWAGWKYSIVRE
jgi:hypothetical protein